MSKTPSVINKRADVLSKIEELFSLLTNEDRVVANNLHQLAIEWDMKIGIGNIRSNVTNTKTNYDITYSAKKPSARSIFLIKINVIDDKPNATFGVKPKLLNLDKYRPITEECPDTIKNVIKNIKECKKCNAKCTQQVTFTLDGAFYNACTYGGEVFENLTADEWDLLQNLTIEEYNAHATV